MWTNSLSFYSQISSYILFINESRLQSGDKVEHQTRSRTTALKGSLRTCRQDRKSNAAFTSSGSTRTAVRTRAVAWHSMWTTWRMASFWLWWSMMRAPTTWRSLPRRVSQVWAASTSAVLVSGEPPKVVFFSLLLWKILYILFDFIHKSND